MIFTYPEIEDDEFMCEKCNAIFSDINDCIDHKKKEKHHSFRCKTVIGRTLNIG